MVSVVPSTAQDASAGPITIKNFVMHQTGPNQLFGTAALDIENTGSVDDHLVDVIADFGDGAFQTKEIDAAGYAKQVIVAGGVRVPAGEVTSLSKDGIQIAFLNLKQRLMGGDEHTITLRFREAGDLVMTVTVRGLGS